MFDTGEENKDAETAVWVSARVPSCLWPWADEVHSTLHVGRVLWWTLWAWRGHLFAFSLL